MNKKLAFLLTAISFAANLSAMTLEEKAGQVLMVHFHGEMANEEAKTLIQGCHIGGIIYYNWANGLNSFEQVRALSAGLQSLAHTPLFIAVDQEGGVVARLGPAAGFTPFAGNWALGMTGDPTLAEESAFAIGQELRSVGVTMNLAPVVDINNNPRNPIIGVRSFGDDAKTVISFAEQALKGYRRAGVISCLKHFPGHGDVEVDSHKDLPIIHKTRRQLEGQELLPFAKLSPFADTVMTAHLLVPALDADQCSTLSSKTLSLLREEMGFSGVIVSDSLVMEGVLKRCPNIDEAVIRAFNAGCDLLILGGKQLTEKGALELTVSDVQRIHKAFVAAVKEGRVSEKRLDNAVAKILDLKKKYVHHRSSPLNLRAHALLSQKGAALALRQKRSQELFLKNKKICIFAPQLLKSSLEKTEMNGASFFFFDTLNPSPQEITASVQRARSADTLLFFSYNAWKNPSQQALLQALSQMGKQVALIATRDPLDASLCPEAAVTITTFSPSLPSLQASCTLLQQRTLCISPYEAQRIAKRIYANECRGKKELLTHWGSGENFGSFGIGHFIWYPEGYRGPFEETFPALLSFLQKQGAPIPSWLETSKTCPWRSREEFYTESRSPRMQELREFLHQTEYLQALFMAHRLETMLHSDAVDDLSRSCFYRLGTSAEGLYALIDYANFKGTGLSSQESYQGQGWGLLHVLQRLSPDSRTLLADFVETAKMLLTQRVLNAPVERQEQRWLSGWLNRLATYQTTDAPARALAR